MRLSRFLSPRLPIALLAASAFFSAPVQAQLGPGIGNIDCGDAEYFEPFAFVENGQGPNGTNVSLIIRGYFMTIFAPDSGNPPGEIGIYDVSNPKAPQEVRHIEGGDTNNFREAHSLPVAWIDGKLYVAIQTLTGIQFWDFTDPLNASRVGNINLPGVNGGDYENVSWQTSWQGRYLYVAGGNLGIFVVDAADPSNPRLLEQVSSATTGGFRVGPLFALGDYMVISNMDQAGAYSILDISVADRPTLLSRIGNLPRIYAIAVGPDRIYAAGRDGDFLIHSFEDPTNIQLVKNARIGEDQLYAAVQDDFVYLGRQNNVVKVDVSDERNPQVIDQGELGRDHPDHGQVTPLGNLVFIGNDHGTGSAFFCIQRGQDTTPPAVETTYPKQDATGVLPGSRLSIMFSDYIDTETIADGSIVVRPAGGEPLQGIFTYAFNTVSFSPDAPFESDTTYEVVMPAGGVKDVMGNGLAEEHLVRFSTGNQIEIPLPEEPPASGGAPGAGGAMDESGGAFGSGGAAGGAPTSVGGSEGLSGSGGVAAQGSGGVGTTGGSGAVSPGSGGAPVLSTGGAPMGPDDGASSQTAQDGCSMRLPARSSFSHFWFLAGLVMIGMSRRRRRP